jgi:hypothetical protein
VGYVSVSLCNEYVVSGLEGCCTMGLGHIPSSESLSFSGVIQQVCVTVCVSVGVRGSIVITGQNKENLNQNFNCYTKVK